MIGYDKRDTCPVVRITYLSCFVIELGEGKNDGEGDGDGLLERISS